MSSRGRIAQVVPDVPTFAVDDGFAYEVPNDLNDVQVGSMVRVPLGSRRIRGYVVSMRTGETEKLKPIVSVSGDWPVFDESLLQTLRWAALHYVAPLSVLLARSAPPNLPRGKGREPESGLPAIESPLDRVSTEAAAGRHVRPTHLITGADYADVIAGLVSGPLVARKNAALVAPTADEARELAAGLRNLYGDRVLFVTSALPAREATRSWVIAARRSGILIVGTPEIALWPLGDPALWIIVEEGRRAMKSKQTPTLQVRDLIRRRSLVERSAVVQLGPVPTLDTLARGAAVVEPPGRVWPLVELVDRREDPPGTRTMATGTVQAIRGTVRQRGQVFVFVSRRGYAPAFRCVRCRELRRCPECGSGPDRGDVCKRCGAQLGVCVSCGGRRFEPLGAGIGRIIDELRRHLSEQLVGEVGSSKQVIVGSERDLPQVPKTALSIAVDADSLLMAPNYRAEEDALRLLARIALTVVKGRGRRLVIQTSQPGHRVLHALRSGHPTALLRQLGDERVQDHLPPAGELVAIEVTGDAAVSTADIEALAGEVVTIHGPEVGGGRTRWFVQGDALQETRIRLRTMVQRWRDNGLKVRIDADPIDL